MHISLFCLRKGIKLYTDTKNKTVPAVIMTVNKVFDLSIMTNRCKRIIAMILFGELLLALVLLIVSFKHIGKKVSDKSHFLCTISRRVFLEGKERNKRSKEEKKRKKENGDTKSSFLSSPSL